MAVILSIIIAGGIGAGIVTALHFSKKFMSAIPYLAIFLVGSVLFIIMENSVSPAAYFLVYFVLATAAIYLDRKILWLSSAIGFTVITVFIYCIIATCRWKQKTMQPFIYFLCLSLLCSLFSFLFRKNCQKILSLLRKKLKIYCIRTLKLKRQLRIVLQVFLS